MTSILSLDERLRDTITSFDELAVSTATPVIDLKSIYGVSDLRDRVAVTGSGSVTTSNGEFVCSTGTTTGSTVDFRSVESGRYIAGFEATPGIGIRLSSMPTSDESARWGYFDANEGFGFGVDVDGMFTFVRRNGVERKNYQQDWYRGNETFTVTNLTIYRMPFRWYGSGPVRYQVSGTGLGGEGGLRTVDFVDALDGETIIGNPNLPVRVEVDNGTTTNDFQVFVGGRQFFVQGMYAPNRRITAEHRLSQSVPSTNFVPLVSFRTKAGFESVSVKLEGLALAVASADILYEIRLVDALGAGAAFATPSNVPATETALEFDTTATALADTGQKISAGLVVGGTGNLSDGSAVDSPQLDLPSDKIVVVCAQAVTGTATVSTVFKAREEW